MESLREPKRKRVGPHIKPQQPFPIWIESESGVALEDGLWPLYFGQFIGDAVVLSNPEEITSVYTMGFFGKGSFSRGYPAFALRKKGAPNIIKERQWQRRKTWMEKMKKDLAMTLTTQLPEAMETSSTNPQEVNNKNDGTSQDEGRRNETTSMDVDKSEEKTIVNGKTADACNSNSHLADGVAFEEQCHSSQSIEKPDTDFSDQVLVLADSDEDDIEKVIRDPMPHLEDEPIKTAVETLNLTFEEAFFLSYALGCLQVIDMSCQPMNFIQMWQTFCEIKSDFIESYVTYHYFRAKGWIVKTGYKFGGDFLLYKQGPPFYHASYIVLVEKVDSKLNRCKESLTWTNLHGLNRLAENSGKDIITCQVVFPDNLTPEDAKTPKSLPKYQVNEVLTKRWVSSQERIKKEQL